MLIPDLYDILHKVKTFRDEKDLIFLDSVKDRLDKSFNSYALDMDSSLTYLRYRKDEKKVLRRIIDG